ncbi:MAG: indole-3-glycerol phosphate synthase TrpC [Thermodesulfobacteriota bacterium]|nr:indole-3-glycerol phosphate synthase TrpC [Thermodesulfobacteriota bacterium]
MILDDIIAHKRKELEHLKGAVPLVSLEKRLKRCEPPRDFKAALRKSSGMSLIAEIKKASPSAGVIRKDVDPVKIANRYENLGASAISVLTDERFFQGTLASMGKVKESVHIPVLRKDFIIDRYQIYEARAFGADAVLLIAAALTDVQLRSFLARCRELDLGTLTEVHTKPELGRAIEAGADVIGINNRDLRTFSVDLSTTLGLASSIPKDTLCVSESGIKTKEDIICLEEAGVDAVLVGTAFMAAGDMEAKVRELFPPGGRGGAEDKEKHV